MNSWLKFIENPEVVKMSENMEINKAKEELEKISSDQHEYCFIFIILTRIKKDIKFFFT